MKNQELKAICDDAIAFIALTKKEAYKIVKLNNTCATSLLGSIAILECYFEAIKKEVSNGSIEKDLWVYSRKLVFN